MTNKDIKKAAEEYEDSLTYSSVKEQYDVQKAFEAGAKWRINSVWYDAMSQPKNNCVVLGISKKYGAFICGPNNLDFIQIAKDFEIYKWTYIKDLIPTED